MSITGLDVFDRAVQRANEWLIDLGHELGKDDRSYAYGVLRNYLHIVRDRVTPEQAVDFASQLPLLLRGVFYEGWHPARTPATYRDADTFLERLVEGARLAGPTEASIAAEGTTRMLRRRMTPSQLDELLDALPEAIRRVLQPHPPLAQAIAMVGSAPSAENVSPTDLPPELRSRVMAATGNADVRVIERRPIGQEGEGYEVFALAGDRFVHMVLRLRADGSVDEVTETFLRENIRGVDIEADRAAVRDGAGRSFPVPAAVAVAVGSVLASQP